mmetsp:Transcript_97600/g.259279  ORF Transcript_97600/g.259279 Transcript_97600/m.259279 type:complete len:248 (+) Transcript_97600:954-1697(+)
MPEGVGQAGRAALKGDWAGLLGAGCLAEVVRPVAGRAASVAHQRERLLHLWQVVHLLQRDDVRPQSRDAALHAQPPPMPIDGGGEVALCPLRVVLAAQRRQPGRRVRRIRLGLHHLLQHRLHGHVRGLARPPSGVARAGGHAVQRRRPRLQRRVDQEAVCRQPVRQQVPLQYAERVTVALRGRWITSAGKASLCDSRVDAEAACALPPRRGDVLLVRLWRRLDARARCAAHVEAPFHRPAWRRCRLP